MNNHRIKALAPLFLVIFIDSIGMGIIFPLLNPLYMAPDGMLAVGTSIATRDFLYGLTLAIFPFFMFFGTPILGDLSDHAGRKKVLLLCLLGVSVSYIFSAIAVVVHSVILLLVSRAIAGLFAGSQATAQAAVIDVCPADDKPKFLSLLLLFASMGFVAGPLLGGFLSSPHLVSWFGFWTPLVLAALLALINAVLLIYSFHETHESRGKIRIHLHQAIGIFITAFRDTSIRRLSIVYLFYHLSWSLFFQYISLLLLQRFDYSNVEIGLFMAMIGLGFAAGFLYFINLFSKHLSQYQILLFSIIVVTAGILAVSLSHVIALLWLLCAVIAILIACSYSVLLSMYSDAVSPEKQGWVMGVTNAVVGVAWTITAVGASQLQQLNPSAPTFSAAIFMLVAVMLTILFARYLRQKKT